MHSENDKDGSGPKETFTGRDVLYREGAVGLLDVQRAADALLRQGRKPSVAAIREQLGGGSPNTITPLLAKYWEKLGGRLGEGPESLERVPEALARVTELLWRRALEEARERLKILDDLKSGPIGMEEVQEQVGKLALALAEARAREGEQLSHLAQLSKERQGLRIERANLLALLKSSQALLEQQSARAAVLEQARARKSSMAAKSSQRRKSARPARTKAVRPKASRALPRAPFTLRARSKVRKPK
jgi:hypothetical protein